MTTVTEVQELQAQLAGFIGSENKYVHLLGIYYTDGVKYLANKAKCFWLLDAIASHQTRKLLSHPYLQDFQIWELQVFPDKSAILSCKENSNVEPIIQQKIPYTDFPLPYIQLYLSQKMLMLTSEY